MASDPIVISWGTLMLKRSFSTETAASSFDPKSANVYRFLLPSLVVLLKLSFPCVNEIKFHRPSFIRSTLSTTYTQFLFFFRVASRLAALKQGNPRTKVILDSESTWIHYYFMLSRLSPVLTLLNSKLKNIHGYSIAFPQLRFGIKNIISKVPSWK